MLVACLTGQRLLAGCKGCFVFTTLSGAFCPSPTGPLHFGSLVAAVGSYLDARTQGGEWLLRMEDVDTPRNVPGRLKIFCKHWKISALSGMAQSSGRAHV